VKILIIGPARCGKTTFALTLFKGLPSGTLLVDDDTQVDQEPASADWIICTQERRNVPLRVRIAADVVFVCGEGAARLWRVSCA
jgi:adenosyl cobinamide kinase/adenosyl cobinamide phosphate guanylyltransferase